MAGPSWDALAGRAVPPWYADAKLGVLLRWGPYSVPAWAPPTGELPAVVAERGWEYWLRQNAWADWYLNSMLIPGSPTQAHHRASWGRLARYDAFARTFRQGLRDWDPVPLLEAVAASGARYLVATAKHHDGFLMWPTRRRNPRRRGWQAGRDVLGDLAEGARARGQRFGVAYSGGMDWTFGGAPLSGPSDLKRCTPRARAYAEYVDAHWRELVSRYEPSILWNDFGSPPAHDVPALFDAFYRAVPDGVVNDRFGQATRLEESLLGRAARRLLAVIGRRARDRDPEGFDPPEARHADFHTWDYAVAPDGEEKPWESVRGMGLSLARNAAEPVDRLLSTADLVRHLVDVVARGGNLLLGVGPDAEGTLDDAVVERLEGLGAWLKSYGEAIYGTRPWDGGAPETPDGIPLRWTTKGMTVYAILGGTPAGRTIVLPGQRFLPYTSVRILGSLAYVTWIQEGRDVHIKLAEPLRDMPAHAVTITPQPRS